MTRNITASAIGCLCLALAGPAVAADDWSWRFGANAWLPSVKSTTNFELPGGGNISGRTDPENYLSNLEFTFMGTLEARRGPWSFFGDVVYLSFGDYEAKVTSVSGPGGVVGIPVDSGTESDLKGFVTTIAGGYAMSQTPAGHLDVFAGARYTRLKVRLDWRLSGPAGGVSASGGVESTKDFFDGVVGVRGKTNLAGNWDLRYYLDAGAGSSRFTWQASAGVGYRFGWGDAVIGWRHLSYEMHDDRPIADMSFSGPQLAVGFTW